MDFSTEFKRRSATLGKRKNHRKEHAILEKILQNPFPIDLTNEPIIIEPETIGWTYFNLDFLEESKILTPQTLASLLGLVEKVFYKAFNIESGGKRVYLDESSNYEALGLRLGTRDMFESLTNHSPEDIGLKNLYEFSKEQARTVLHLLRFKKTDYEGNLWE